MVDLNYKFEYDWLIVLSDNKLSNSKLSDDSLAGELVKNRSFLNQSIEEIVIFMITMVTKWQRKEDPFTAVSTKVAQQKRKSVRDNADWYYG